MERRATIEFRLADRKLTGYAATFGVRAKIADFTETIAPGAFKGSLAGGTDVVALVDHDPGKLLARTRSGTLRLNEDDRGLRFELDLPETQLGRDTLALVERGDIGGASFGFTIPAGGDQWRGSDRTLLKVNLVDISIVNSWPAYPQTSVSARSHGERRLSLALARRLTESFR